MPHETQQQALLALRVLVAERTPAETLNSLRWSTLLPLARDNAVLVRLAERVRRAGGHLSAAVSSAVDQERDRVSRTLELASRLADNCSRHRIRHVLPKLVQHYPDMGGDLDLLVLDESPEVDRLVLGDLDAIAKPTTIQNRLARTTTYVVEPGTFEVDIHHGRLGALGEHRWLPENLLELGRRLTLDAGEFTVPSPEYQVVLQGIQKTWGRSSFRLAAVISTHQFVRSGLDWNLVLDLASRLNVLHSVSCYLSYVEQIHREARLGPLLPDSIRSRLALMGWGRARFRGARFRIPTLRVHARTYLATWARAAATADWHRLERLTLAPMVTVAGALPLFSNFRWGARRAGRPDPRRHRRPRHAAAGSFMGSLAEASLER